MGAATTEERHMKAKKTLGQKRVAYGTGFEKKPGYATFTRRDIAVRFGEIEKKFKKKLPLRRQSYNPITILAAENVVALSKKERLGRTNFLRMDDAEFWASVRDQEKAVLNKIARAEARRRA
jgi:hypothetical protein